MLKTRYGFVCRRSSALCEHASASNGTEKAERALRRGDLFAEAQAADRTGIFGWDLFDRRLVQRPIASRPGPAGRPSQTLPS